MLLMAKDIIFFVTETDGGYNTAQKKSDLLTLLL